MSVPEMGEAGLSLNISSFFDAIHIERGNGVKATCGINVSLHLRNFRRHGLRENERPKLLGGGDDEDSRREGEFFFVVEVFISELRHISDDRQ